MRTKWNSITAIPGSLPGKRTCNGVRGCRITNQPSRSQKQPRITKPMTQTRRAKSGRATAIPDSRRRNSLRVGRPQKFAVVAQTAVCPNQGKFIVIGHACLGTVLLRAPVIPSVHVSRGGVEEAPKDDLGIARIDRARRVFFAFIASL